MLVYDLLNRVPFSEVSYDNLPQLYIPPREEVGHNQEGQEREDELSPLTQRTLDVESGLSSIQREGLAAGFCVNRDHILVKTKEREKDGKPVRRKRKDCDICRVQSTPKSNKRLKKTANRCITCNIAICDNDCLQRHRHMLLRQREIQLYAE